MRVVRGVALLLCGCGVVVPRDLPDPSALDASSDAMDLPPFDGGPPCSDPQCTSKCPPSSPTTIIGTVFAPNGTLPLPNVLVYVPKRPLDPLVKAPNCGCGVVVSGEPLVATLTDVHGRFALRDVPSGANIPIVVQTERWRRVSIVPSVNQCSDNPAPLLRLPRNRTEGDMPRIAVATGGCDPVACVLPKLGVDPQEMGVDSSAATRVVLYQGEGGGGPTGIKPASTLWSDSKELAKFDVALLSSECAANDQTKTSPSTMQAWVDAGGRVFLSGSHATWADHLVADWKQTASWGANVSASGPFTVITSSPRGKVLADWLDGLGATSSYGQIDGGPTPAHVGPVDPKKASPFVLATGGATSSLAFGAPLGVPLEQQCGRVVYVGLPSTGVVDAGFPQGCAGGLTPSELVLAYHLFSMRLCMTDTPPPVPQ